MCWCVHVCVRSHVQMHTPTLTLLYPHPVLRDYHYSRANKPVPLETPEPLNIMDKYLGDEFAGTPLELAEDDKTLLVDSDKELLGQLAAAVTLAADTLCVSPDIPEPGAEAEAEGDAGVPGLVQGLKVEEELLKARAASLQARMRAVIEDVRARQEQLHARMDALLGARFRGEMEAIKALCDEIKRRIESGERLLHQLSLDVADFVVDEDALTYAIVPAPPALETREQLPPFRLTTAHLAGLTAWCKSAAPAGQVTVEALVSMLHRAAAVPGMKLLPAQWIALAPSKLRALVQAYETSGREGRAACVDWRRLLFSLADAPPPSVEQLQELCQAAGVGKAAVPRDAARALPMWIDALAAPEAVTGDDGQPVVLGHQPAKLKDAVLDMFTSPSGDVNVEHLLLYACAGTLVDSVDKAVRVLGHAEGQVDAPTLTSILSLGSLSCFDAPASAGDDSEAVAAALADALEGKEEGAPLTVAELVARDKGLAVVSWCQGLEAKSPYALLSNL